MPETITYLDGNWNPTDDESKAVMRLITVTDEAGNVLRKTRETMGNRKGRTTYSTDPRAGAIMREGGHGAPPMSNPQGH